MKKYSGSHSVNSKKKHGVIRHSGLVICSILFILCSCMYFGMFRVSAKEIDQQRTSDAIEICYTSRLIEPGDSLWSIAEETITDRYGSVSAISGKQIAIFFGFRECIYQYIGCILIPFIIFRERSSGIDLHESYLNQDDS